MDLRSGDDGAVCYGLGKFRLGGVVLLVRYQAWRVGPCPPTPLRDVQLLVQHAAPRSGAAGEEYPIWEFSTRPAMPVYCLWAPRRPVQAGARRGWRLLKVMPGSNPGPDRPDLFTFMRVAS